ALGSVLLQGRGVTRRVLASLVRQRAQPWLREPRTARRGAPVLVDVATPARGLDSDRPHTPRARYRRPRSLGATRRASGVDLPLEEERDDPREQDEGLDQGETEDHRRLNARRGAWVARDPLEGSSRSPALAHRAAEGGDADGETSGRGSPRVP